MGLFGLKLSIQALGSERVIRRTFFSSSDFSSHPRKSIPKELDLDCLFARKLSMFLVERSNASLSSVMGALSVFCLY